MDLAPISAANSLPVVCTRSGGRAGGWAGGRASLLGQFGFHLPPPPPPPWGWVVWGHRWLPWEAPRVWAAWAICVVIQIHY